MDSIIPYAAFVDVYEALAFANCQGSLVDAALDISWSLHGIVEEQHVGCVQSAFLLATAHWLSSRGLAPFFIWSVERGDRRGLHTHITLALPPEHDAAFRLFLDAELTRLVRAPLVQTAGSKTYMLQTFPRETSMHQWRRFKYLTKALDPCVDLNGQPTSDLSQSLAWVTGLKLELGGRVGMPRLGVAPALAAPRRSEWQMRYPLPDWTMSFDRPLTFNDRFIEWYEEHVDRLCLGGAGRRPPSILPDWCRS